MGYFKLADDPITGRAGPKPLLDPQLTVMMSTKWIEDMKAVSCYDWPFPP